LENEFVLKFFSGFGFAARGKTPPSIHLPPSGLK